MKKILICFSAFSIMFYTSCSSKKQPGEEYYDPDYKPQVTETSSVPTDGTETTGEVDSPALTDETTTTTPAAGQDSAGAEDKTAASTTTTPATETAAKEPAKAATPATPAKTVGDVAKGKALIEKSDCLACHKVDVKIVGPAYADVAKKYEANDKNLTYLANKIIKGGAGAWGDVPMSPHPTLSPGDAREMAKYVLSLK